MVVETSASCAFDSLGIGWVGKRGFVLAVSREPSSIYLLILIVVNCRVKLSLLVIIQRQLC